MTWLRLAELASSSSRARSRRSSPISLLNSFGGPAWVERGLGVAQVLQRDPHLAEPPLGPGELVLRLLHCVARRAGGHRVDELLARRHHGVGDLEGVLRGEGTDLDRDDPGRQLDVGLDLPAPVFDEVLDRVGRMEAGEPIDAGIHRPQADRAIQILDDRSALDVVDDDQRVLRLGERGHAGQCRDRVGRNLLTAAHRQSRLGGVLVGDAEGDVTDHDEGGNREAADEPDQAGPPCSEMAEAPIVEGAVRNPCPRRGRSRRGRPQSARRLAQLVGNREPALARDALRPFDRVGFRLGRSCAHRNPSKRLDC